jgi:hypothetical protein
MQRWGTHRALGMALEGAASSGAAAVQPVDWAPMVAVELPAAVAQQLPAGAAGAAALHARLRSEFRIEVPVAAVGGALWVRVSAQVHNELADYEQLAQAIQGMCV